MHCKARWRLSHSEVAAAEIAADNSSSSNRACVLTRFRPLAVSTSTSNGFSNEAAHPLVEKLSDVTRPCSESEERERVDSMLHHEHEHQHPDTESLSSSSRDNAVIPEQDRVTCQCLKDLQRREFQSKRHRFYYRLAKQRYGCGASRIKLHVQRNSVLEESFVKLMSVPLAYLKHSHLAVVFTGEEGKDYGGLSREFFTILSTRLFSPQCGLFEYSPSADNYLQISSASATMEHHIKWFQFAGRVLALALIHRCLINVSFVPSLYKALLGRSPVLGIEDLKEEDPLLYQNLIWILNNDVSALELVFATDENIFGQVVEHDLKTRGRSKPVTEENKKDYVKRLVAWRLQQRVAKQTKALVKGFSEVLDLKTLSQFSVNDLRFMISGSNNQEINVLEWRLNTEYQHEYDDSHPVIGWFWEVVEQYDNEQRRCLLQFVTGTSTVPLEGFAALRGSNGVRHKFCIDSNGPLDSLPRAHTCFNRLHLPPYWSAEVLRDKLNFAINETNTFEMA